MPTVTLSRCHDIGHTSHPRHPGAMRQRKSPKSDSPNSFSSLNLALDLAPASELAVLPVHHHDTLDQRVDALLELLVSRVLADIVVAVLGAGKLDHLCPVPGSARAMMRSSTRPGVQGVVWAGASLTKPWVAPCYDRPSVSISSTSQPGCRWFRD